MKKQVLVYVKPAAELKVGDRILTSRGTVTEVTKCEPFSDATKRSCIEVETAGRIGERRPLSVFLSDEYVLVVE